MTFLLLAGISWACPGGMLSGLWPAAIKPLICQPKPLVEHYDPAQAPRAKARAIETGADLQACRLGRGCRSITKRLTVVTFEEAHELQSPAR